MDGARLLERMRLLPADPFLSLGLLHQLVRGHRLVRLVRACVHVSMAAACLESSAWDGG